jgi:lipopolysaccharide heptosyltransferase I
LKILIIKPSSLGDIVHALPVLRLLKKNLNHSKISWLVFEEYAGLLEHDPDLSNLIVIQRKNWLNPGAIIKFFNSFIKIQKIGFDWVIDLQGLFRSGIFAWLAKGDLTIGVENQREKASIFYDISVPRPSDHPHAVDWYLAVLKRLGIPNNLDFEWIPPNQIIFSKINDKWKISHYDWLTIIPGSKWLTKCWPPEYFSETIKILAHQYPNLKFALLGSKADSLLCAKISENLKNQCLNLAGKLSLSEMVECLRASKLVIANDTGPMHVAAALKRPIITIFGPTDPSRTGPYGYPPDATIVSNVPCRPCFSKTCNQPNFIGCLKAITPDQVITRANALLAK